MPRFATQRFHRDLSLLAAGLVAVHVVTAVLDPFAGIGWLASIVPLASPYRPVWIGLGAASVDLGIALVLTSLLRGRLSYRAWRAVHVLAYLSWPIAVLHSVNSSIDLRLSFVSATIWASVAVVALAVLWRIVSYPNEPAPPPGAPRRRAPATPGPGAETKPGAPPDTAGTARERVAVRGRR